MAKKARRVASKSGKSRASKKPPKTGASKRRSGKRASVPRGRPKQRAAPSSIAREIARRDRAIDEIGAKVKRGAVRIGSTRRLTPTKAGFRSLKSAVRAVRAVQKKGKPKAYSFKLSIRYRGPDGRFKTVEKVEGSFPLPAAVRRRRKKGESEAKAFERLTETRIKGAVFRAIDRQEGVAQYSPAVERALASGDRDRITRAMRAFKKRRGVSFKVDIQRHVTGATRATSKKQTRAKKAVRGGARHGRRRKR